MSPLSLSRNFIERILHVRSTREALNALLLTCLAMRAATFSIASAVEMRSGYTHRAETGMDAQRTRTHLCLHS